MEEIVSFHDDLEYCLNKVKVELSSMLAHLYVSDYHHDETLRYLGHIPETELNEGEIPLTKGDVSMIRSSYYDAISETEETLLPYFKTKK